MRHFTQPEVGHWYQGHEMEEPFCVVAIDDAEKVVEIQQLNGELAELDLSIFFALSLDEIAAPEDWREAYDLDGE